MTASEFAFLALGLVLGVASGAALSIVIRASRRPRARFASPWRRTPSRDGPPRPCQTGSTGRDGGGGARRPAIRRPRHPRHTLTEARALALAGGGPAAWAERPFGRALAPPVGIPIRPAPDALLGALALASSAVVRRRARAEAGRRRRRRIGCGRQASAHRDRPAATDPSLPDPWVAESSGSPDPATGVRRAAPPFRERCALAAPAVRGGHRCERPAPGGPARVRRPPGAGRHRGRDGRPAGGPRREGGGLAGLPPGER